MSLMTLRSPGALALGLALATMAVSAAELGAQGLPAYMPINPVATSRSGVYFQPYRDAELHGWTVGLDLDYANAIEYNRRTNAEYILDSELLRLDVAAKHDLGRKSFVLIDMGVRGAYDGFLDGFLDWYHKLLGIRLREREARPHNAFLYRVALAGTTPFERSSGDLFLGDLRVGSGWRYSPSAQGVVSVTLPTATGPEGYGRGVMSASVLHTVRTPLSRRIVYEGSLGMGYTPTRGPLAPFQREAFAAVTSGLRMRVWGRQALYANLFYHSPYYHGTTLPALDQYELSLDFGWLLATCGGSEWRFGLVEDPKPSGPGVDLVIRLGAAFRTGTAPCAEVKIPSHPHHAD